jgi:hypothetical protein
VLRPIYAEQLPTMTTKFPSNAFTYIDCDIPGDQTLAEWRRERDAVRLAQRRPRRLRRMARERWARWTA